MRISCGWSVVQFMFASGVLFIIVTIAVALFKTEDEPLEGIPGVFGAPPTAQPIAPRFIVRKMGLAALALAGWQRGRDA